MEYEKDFEGWNKVKKNTENGTYIPYFDVGEIWWCMLGINIGSETDGKGDNFLRPVLILRKYNQYGCLIIPLSSVHKEDKNNFSVGIIEDKNATINLSQPRSVSPKRFVEKICKLEYIHFIRIQKTVMEYNFPSQSFEIPSPSKTESSPKAIIN